MHDRTTTRPDGPRAVETGTTLSPVQLPFTIETDQGTAPPRESEKGWHHRLGVWWDDAPDPDSGVVVTGIKPGAASASGGGLGVGDVIVQVNDRAVQSLGDIVRGLEAYAPGSVRFTVHRPLESAPRVIALDVPANPTTAANTGVRTPPKAARVPVADLKSSLQRYIECVLSNPLQWEVTQVGTAADPEFGCLGADLEFSIQAVGLSEIRNAIVKCEPRLKEVDVTAVEIEVREKGEVDLRPGIRVDAKLSATNEFVRIELEVREVTRKRSSNRLRRLTQAAEAGAP